jgi:hypothetical protein
VAVGLAYDTCGHFRGRRATKVLHAKELT